ncbi:hypothetical protein JM47_02940 [Ureaplasma diversum]|uniref:Uncharacterized protein n=2 Tax=Ureaplasma diversum TaxID=42094 RepID=A0A084F101_9BACT|nr:hypothetical protein [Ureaplasma diversum]AJQ45502.1 hypothetical protein JM47_02940 [Ureaplasma diversum]KEZ23893.1 hypothetical protein UDIV_2140 [Ureaplasma diversum NCTC 246]
MTKKDINPRLRVTKTVVFDEQEQERNKVKKHKKLPRTWRIVISVLLTFCCACVIVLLVYVITYLYSLEVNA